MSEVVLSRRELRDILGFLNSFPAVDTITVTITGSFGIDRDVKATVNYTANGHEASITKDVTRFESW